jgi:hypothetical protein
MDEALPIAIGAAALAFRPIRRRILPVLEATVAAGAGMVAAGVVGARTIASAAAHGEAKLPEPRLAGIPAAHENT